MVNLCNPTYFFRISRCISSLKSLIFPNQDGRCRRIVILGSARWKFAAIHKSTNICKKKYNQTYVHTYNKLLISGTSSIFSFLQNLIFIFDESKLHTFSLFLSETTIWRPPYCKRQIFRDQKQQILLFCFRDI